MIGRSNSSASEVKGVHGKLVGIAALAVAMLAGLALAQPAGSVSAVYTAGRLQAPQVVAGLGFRSVMFSNHAGASTTFDVYQLLPGTSLAAFSAASAGLQAALAGAGDLGSALQQVTSLAVPQGSAVVGAHGSSEILVNFRQGNYVIAATPAGRPDGASYATFHATTGGTAAGGPNSTSTLKLSDSSVESPVKVSSGANLWAISNTGSQAHFVRFYRLLRGKSADDLKAYLASNGASGAKPYDKTTLIGAVAPGTTIYRALTLASGTWMAVASGASTTAQAGGALARVSAALTSG